MIPRDFIWGCDKYREEVEEDLEDTIESAIKGKDVTSLSERWSDSELLFAYALGVQRGRETSSKSRGTKK